MEECLICCESSRTFIDFSYCTCKFNICEPCFTRWNQETAPALHCPVCRQIYGRIIPPVQYYFSETRHIIVLFRNPVNQSNYIVYTIVYLILLLYFFQLAYSLYLI